MAGAEGQEDQGIQPHKLCTNNPGGHHSHAPQGARQDQAYLTIPQAWGRRGQRKTGKTLWIMTRVWLFL